MASSLDMEIGDSDEEAMKRFKGLVPPMVSFLVMSGRSLTNMIMVTLHEV